MKTLDYVRFITKSVLAALSTIVVAQKTIGNEIM